MPVQAAPRPEAKPTTDALKAATARMWQEQQDALRTANTYRSKLDEASAYLQRLETAYTAMLKQNSDLRGKVVTIKGSNAGLATKMGDQEAGLKVAQDTIADLAAEVAAGEHTRRLRPFMKPTSLTLPISLRV